MSSSLGKSLQRTKRANQVQNRQKYKTLIETEREAALEAEHLRQSGTGRVENLKSIWETNDLENFLSIADAREEGYFAERNVRVVIDGKVHVIQEDKIVPEAHVESGSRNWLELSAQLTIPKRPAWGYEMSAAAIQEEEKKAFLHWRRSIAGMEEQHKVVVTPYEKNLEVWRQLWRVVERADVVAMILDARNPLIFRCADFESYVRGIPNRLGQPKKLVLLLNKADLLTETQRRAWAAYFQSKGDTFFFFSARPLTAEAREEGSGVEGPPQHEDDDDDDDEANLESDITRLEGGQEPADAIADAPVKAVKTRRSGKRALRRPVEVANPYELLEKRRVDGAKAAAREKPPPPPTAEEISRNARLAKDATSAAAGTPPWAVRGAVDLLDEFARLRAESGLGEGAEGTPLMVGLVGYPDVGKSSTVNAILGAKKTLVSATPGKTKHFQTLSIPNERRVGLCDGPGLVFPSFASTKEQMVCDGILPVDTATDVQRATSVICDRLPRGVFEAAFNVSLAPGEDGGEGRAEESEGDSPVERLLGALARQRGYMASHDRPDRARAGKELLKKYVDGKLVYVEPPPTYNPDAAALSIERFLSSAKGGAEGENLPSAADDKGSVEPPQPSPEPNDAETSSADYEDWNSEDERAWADIDEVDEHENETFEKEGYRSTDNQDLMSALPVFYSRPLGLRRSFTRYEHFNIENNLAWMTIKKVEKRRKKNTNHQLEEDPYTFVNKHGEVELRIDDDDGVVELVMAPGRGQQRLTTNTKVKSKRQQRREAKKMGLGPLNPSAKRIHIQDY